LLSFLIDDSIQVGKAPSLALDLLAGTRRPEIGKPTEYIWRVGYKGSTKYTYLKKLKVSLTFQPKPPFVIKEIIPSEKEVKKGEVQAALEFRFATLSSGFKAIFPLNIKEISTKITPEGAEWIFNDIQLPEDLYDCISGGIAVDFLEEADAKKFKIGMRIEPEFCRKGIFGMGYKFSPDQPRIEHLTVADHCKDVIPYDPKYGPSSYDSPDKERIHEYAWEIEEGILKRGILGKKSEIRIVGLRAKTLSILFKEIQKSLPEGRNREFMRATGREIGKSFVSDAEKCLGQKPSLKQWSDVDSIAGMGKFSFYDAQNLQTIEVKNSFIAYDGPLSEKPVCDWLAGYFEGVLEKLSNERFVITEEKCIAEGASRCIFSVRKEVRP
jgi:predicted hydrocarbon binding protein